MEKVKQTEKSNKFADVPVRVRSWLYIIVILGVGLLHPLLTALLFTILSAQCVREFLKLKKVSDNIFPFIPLLIIELFSAYDNQYMPFIIASMLYVVLFLLNKDRKAYVTTILVSFVALGHLPFMIYLNLTTDLWYRVSPLLFLIILTEMNDIFQYLSGKLLGKHKAFPVISPNKTIEGCYGGIILTTLLSCVLGRYFLPELSIMIYLPLGLMISILGLCGDLFMSYQKRLAGVKDTGTLIPGHGGLLDRMDSLIFIAPVYYWILRWIL